LVNFLVSNENDIGNIMATDSCIFVLT